MTTKCGVRTGSLGQGSGGGDEIYPDCSELRSEWEMRKCRELGEGNCRNYRKEALITSLSSFFFT